jgi:hypothetical protein
METFYYHARTRQQVELDKGVNAIVGLITFGGICAAHGKSYMTPYGFLGLGWFSYFVVYGFF